MGITEHKVKAVPLKRWYVERRLVVRDFKN